MQFLHCPLILNCLDPTLWDNDKDLLPITPTSDFFNRHFSMEYVLSTQTELEAEQKKMLCDRSK